MKIKSQSSIRVLHSLHDKQLVFKKFCELTFDLPELENTYVDSLSQISIEQINSYDFIVVHYLRAEDAKIISSLNIKIPLALFSWGSDIFNLGRFEDSFLLPKTLRLKRKLLFRYPLFQRVKKLIHSYIPILLDLRIKNKERIKAFSLFKTITPVMPGDFELLQAKYSVSAELHHLNYVNPSLENSNSIANGAYILLGNSATFTNNHLEAIDILSSLELGNKKILIPLSYGEKEYARIIEKAATEKLGVKNVEILNNFLPPEEYQAKLEQCEIVIMNHIRQQAVGNIVQALALGAHVYLQKKSTVFSYLKLHDFHVSEICNGMSLTPLRDDQKKHNIELVHTIFGKQLQHKRLRSLIQKLIP